MRKNTLSKSFRFCLPPLASFQSFVVTSPSFKRNHVGNGYVLGSSAHLEVCLTLTRTALLVLVLTKCRTLAASAFFLSIAVYTSMLPGYYVIWHTPYIWQFPPQLWRLVTSFLITGKDLSIIFDTYFCMDHRACRHTGMWLTSTTVYTYGSKLETASPRFSQPGDFMSYILFVCLTILVGNFSLFFRVDFFSTSQYLPA
jgi:hypothetical protein